MVTKQESTETAVLLMWMCRGPYGHGLKVGRQLLHSTALHSTAQHCTAKHSTAQHCTALHICRLSLNIAAGWSDAQREEKRQELRFVLDATVCAQGGTIFYYQGLHDIASVLLLVMGDRTAYQTLTHLSLCQLRDCTRYSPFETLQMCCKSTATTWCQESSHCQGYAWSSVTAQHIMICSKDAAKIGLAKLPDIYLHFIAHCCAEVLWMLCLSC